MRAGNQVVFDEQGMYIEGQGHWGKDLRHRRWRDVHGEDVGQQEGGFLAAGERAGESTWIHKWEWRLTSLRRKTLSSLTKKTHDQKIEVQVKKKVSKQDEKTKVKKAGEPKSLVPVLCEGTGTQHESSQKPGHQQGQVQRGTDDEHGLLLYAPGG